MKTQESVETKMVELEPGDRVKWEFDGEAFTGIITDSWLDELAVMVDGSFIKVSIHKDCLEYAG